MGGHDGDDRGDWRGRCFSGVFPRCCGPSAGREGGVSARRDSAALPAGGAGRGGNLHRYRPVRDEEAGVVAAFPAVSRWDARPRPSGRHLRDAGRGEIPALLRRLGRGADRGCGRGDRHRHHRRHGMPTRHCQDHHRQAGRLRSRPQRQPGVLADDVDVLVAEPKARDSQDTIISRHHSPRRRGHAP